MTDNDTLIEVRKLDVIMLATCYHRYLNANTSKEAEAYGSGLLEAQENTRVYLIDQTILKSSILNLRKSIERWAHDEHAILADQLTAFGA